MKQKYMGNLEWQYEGDAKYSFKGHGATLKNSLVDVGITLGMC